LSAKAAITKEKTGLVVTKKMEGCKEIISMDPQKSPKEA
jgi:hypothetical protein